MKLSEINRRFPRDPGSREAVRLFEQRRLLKEARAPQTGLYYWGPTKNGWRIFPFFQEQYPGATHGDVWSKWASTILCVEQSQKALPREVRNAQYGLPRGRVTKIKMRGELVYLISHGDDVPTDDPIDGIVEKFNLPYGQFKASVDNHEHMLRSDIVTIQQFLGKDLGLLSKAVPDNWGDEEYDD